MSGWVKKVIFVNALKGWKYILHLLNRLDLGKWILTVVNLLRREKNVNIAEVSI